MSALTDIQQQAAQLDLLYKESLQRIEQAEKAMPVKFNDLKKTILQIVAEFQRAQDKATAIPLADEKLQKHLFTIKKEIIHTQCYLLYRAIVAPTLSQGRKMTLGEQDLIDEAAGITSEGLSEINASRDTKELEEKAKGAINQLRVIKNEQLKINVLYQADHYIGVRLTGAHHDQTKVGEDLLEKIKEEVALNDRSKPLSYQRATEIYSQVQETIENLLAGREIIVPIAPEKPLDTKNPLTREKTIFLNLITQRYACLMREVSAHHPNHAAAKWIAEWTISHLKDANEHVQTVNTERELSLYSKSSMILAKKCESYFLPKMKEALMQSILQRSHELESVVAFYESLGIEPRDARASITWSLKDAETHVLKIPHPPAIEVYEKGFRYRTDLAESGLVKAFAAKQIAEWEEKAARTLSLQRWEAAKTALIDFWHLEEKRPFLSKNKFEKEVDGFERVLFSTYHQISFSTKNWHASVKIAFERIESLFEKDKPTINFLGFVYFMEQVEKLAKRKKLLFPDKERTSFVKEFQEALQNKAFRKKEPSLKQVALQTFNALTQLTERYQGQLSSEMIQESIDTAYNTIHTELRQHKFTPDSAKAVIRSMEAALAAAARPEG